MGAIVRTSAIGENTIVSVKTAYLLLLRVETAHAEEVQKIIPNYIFKSFLNWLHFSYILFWYLAESSMHFKPFSNFFLSKRAEWVGEQTKETRGWIISTTPKIYLGPAKWFGKTGHSAHTIDSFVLKIQKRPRWLWPISHARATVLCFWGLQKLWRGQLPMWGVLSCASLLKKDQDDPCEGYCLGRALYSWTDWCPVNRIRHTAEWSKFSENGSTGTCKSKK